MWLCFLSLMLIAALSITGLLILRYGDPPPLTTGAVTFKKQPPVPRSFHIGSQSQEATVAKADTKKLATPQALLRKPTPQTSPYTVTPLLEKKTVGMEFSVAF
jgi:hypothetical protein